jgi:hypothetical protein
MLDLMKLDIERPAAPVDISRLPLAAIEDLSDGELRIGAQASNSDLAAAAGPRDTWRGQIAIYAVATIELVHHPFERVTSAERLLRRSSFSVRVHRRSE